MRNLGPRFSISDVALKKIFTKANIPVPERGYWAKREAGKKAVQRPLPPRSPGVDDKFLVGGDGQYGRFEPTDQEILGSAPEPPLFAEPIETVRERVYKQISKVRMPKAVAALHPAISACLEADECRRQKATGRSSLGEADLRRADRTSAAPTSEQPVSSLSKRQAALVR